MDNEIDAVASSTTIGTLTDITQIGANANTDAIDIEFVCVTILFLVWLYYILPTSNKQRFKV